MKTQPFCSNPYAWLWFHLESPFIRDPELRRPFTFIIRDFYHAHPILWTWMAIFTWYWLSRWFISFDSFVLISLGILLGHLFWGSKYTPGQQEWPPYDPGTTD
jgi:hypothetical protein